MLEKQVLQQSYTHCFIKYKQIKSEEYQKLYKNQEPPVKNFNNTIYRHIRRTTDLFDQKINKGCSLSKIRTGTLSKQKQIAQQQKSYERNQNKRRKYYTQSFTEQLRQNSPKNNLKINKTLKKYISKSQSATQNVSLNTSSVSSHKKSHIKYTNLFQNKGSSCSQLQNLKDKTATINKSIKYLHLSMQKSRQKLTIVEKFHKLTEKYIDNTPIDFEEQKREQLEFQEQVSKYYQKQLVEQGKQDLVKIQEIGRKAKKIKKYQAPIINKQLKEHYFKQKEKLKLKIKAKGKIKTMNIMTKQ